MKFLNFMEKRIDPFLKIELTDLAKTLANQPDLNLDFAYHSYYKKQEAVVTVSHYWHRLLDETRVEGMKSDVYLRAFGNRHATDYKTISAFLSTSLCQSLPSFSKQLLALLEDYRLEGWCIQKRPGMFTAFQYRRAFLQKRMRERFTVHKRQEQWLDALFCALYLQLIERPTVLPDPIKSLKPVLRYIAKTIHETQDTKSVTQLAAKLLDAIDNQEFRDMTSNYFTLHGQAKETGEVTQPEGERESLISESETEENTEEKDNHDESMPSWHQEQEESGDNFMQFDLDEGKMSDLIGEGERQMEDGDQAFASVQGDAKASDGQNYDDLDNNEQKQQSEGNGTEYAYGEANRAATEDLKPSRRPTEEERHEYRTIQSQLQHEKKALQRAIQKTIETKQIAPRSELHIGRLGKKLLKLITEDNPRLFYKKNQDSNEFNVTFSLLVDCSASMYNKMDETKAGIVLFHETLKSLNIPHTVTGFWEDALSADDKEQPNIFHKVIQYERSLLPREGEHIMQLEPEEDNRDGFSIRVAQRDLMKRPEKHKILLVFTDGEPSAYNYDDNGIVDTKEAVIHTRKQGTEIIGMFLADGEPQEREKETLKNIYGRQCVIVPTAEEIPSHLAPLLKKLLLKHI